MQNSVTEGLGPKAKKRRLLLAVIAVAVLIAVIGFILILQPWSLFKGKRAPSTMYATGNISEIVFREPYPDGEYDIMTDADYLALDRYIYYTVGAESVAITDGNFAEYGPAAVFFAEYFETVIAGDAEKYNTFFTDRYYKEVLPYSDFTPQMLYGINVKLLSAVAEDDVTRYSFEVNYRIFKNDGTFRRDIGSDANRRLYFELVGNADGIKIDYTASFVTQ